jgi:hypothetical protein
VKWEKTDLIKMPLSKGANPNVPISPASDSDKEPNLAQHVGMRGNEEILKVVGCGRRSESCSIWK